ncbi:MAG: hypothetical protein AMS14_11685 [Planctomycetes bacterium DG_20]|nr:MAG: hypothetical protein AMS14_11685 [Planctomycetes bacterium DG_20]
MGHHIVHGIKHRDPFAERIRDEDAAELVDVETQAWKREAVPPGNSVRVGVVELASIVVNQLIDGKDSP